MFWPDSELDYEIRRGWMYMKSWDWFKVPVKVEQINSYSVLDTDKIEKYFPPIWLQAFITPIFKDRLIAPACTSLCEIMKTIIKN